MKKATVEVKRLSSLTLFKVMLITGLFPWILIDTAIILYHLLTGDFVVDLTRKVGTESVPEQISIGKYILLSYPVFVIGGVIFVLLFWVPCAFSLWLWSKIRTMQITYYE